MDSINNLAVLYMQTDRRAEAEPLYREGYEVSRQLLGDEHPNTLPAMSNLAACSSSRESSMKRN